MRLCRLKIGKKHVKGLQVKLGAANLVLAATNRGYISCGYIDLVTAERLDDVACKVTGVKTISDLLNAKIVGATTAARKIGIKEGMVAREAIKQFL